MDEQIDEKAVVKIGTDGSPVKCAKGGDLEGCGYKAGAKVCGKCGAMAVEVKKTEDAEMPMEDEETDPTDAMPDVTMEDVAGDADYMDEEDKKKKYADLEGDPESVWERDKSTRKRARNRRLQTMGVKSEEVADDAYVCGISRKMHPGAAAPCAGCTGGCAPEAELPTLLEVEGLAEDTFGGKVLASGYSDIADMFLVDLRRKDGRTFEVLFDGVTAEPVQWSLLRTEEVDEKSLEQVPTEFIGFDEAVKIAEKTVEGHVIAVDVDTYEGYDVYAVAVDTISGKSYDVFLATDGEVLEIKQYSVDDSDDPEEFGEDDKKADYSEDERSAMVESGEALPDGSYPIKNGSDLKNAIQAFGRAKDKGAAKAHIMKRAKDLDMEDMIPESWTQKSEEQDFLATLMEFELLNAELDTDTDS